MKKLIFVLALVTISLASCGKRYTCPTYTMNKEKVNTEIAQDSDITFFQKK